MADPKELARALAKGTKTDPTWTQRLADALWNPQAMGLDKPLPMEGRATFLPAMRSPGSDHPQWALPGVLASMVNGMTFPSRAMEGSVPRSQMVPEALNAAGNVSLDSYALSRALKGAIPRADQPSTDVGMTVYHGSPHQFEQFDSGRIGTGEGNQAYGHGLYFAENPEVAGSYVGNADLGDLYSQRGVLRMSNKPVPKELESAIAAAEASNKGNLYHVDIPDEAVSKMLDWDKPLSEQPEAVQRIVQRVSAERQAMDSTKGYKSLGLGDIKRDSQGQPVGSVTGGAIHEFLSAKRYGGSQAATAKILKDAGVPGIRYLDAGSRDAAQGTRNIVLFDDKLAKITKRE